MTIYWNETGPLLRYGDEHLRIEDLNPQISVRWRLSRLERLAIAWGFFKAAVFWR